MSLEIHNSKLCSGIIKDITTIPLFFYDKEI